MVTMLHSTRSFRVYNVSHRAIKILLVITSYSTSTLVVQITFKQQLHPATSDGTYNNSSTTAIQSHRSQRYATPEYPSSAVYSVVGSVRILVLESACILSWNIWQIQLQWNNRGYVSV